MSSFTSAARPKRAGDEFLRSHENISKKPRFDPRNPSTLAPDAAEEEDDPILAADVIGKSGRGIKRNAVNIDGYESDSDNDNFDERAATKAREAGPSKDEEQDDMFADLEKDMQGTRDGDDDEDIRRQGKKIDKNVRFLDPSEIEGEVRDSRSGGKVSGQLMLDKNGKASARDEDQESDSESSGSDEDRAALPDHLDAELAAEVGAGGKKQHAPRLEAFNLEEEQEDGKFDESGNYIRKAVDPDADNDRWLEGVSKKDMKQAREAQQRREAERKQRAAEDDALLTSDILSTLISHLEAGETALEALQRLNKGHIGLKTKKVPKWKQKKQMNNADSMEVDPIPQEEQSDPAERARKAAVDDITSAADGLYTRGSTEIYSTEREMLMRLYTRETGEQWQPPSKKGHGDSEDASGTWEFRWSDARDEGEIHGPYDAATMSAWREAGYFGEGVEFRQGGHEWTRVLDL